MTKHLKSEDSTQIEKDYFKKLFHLTLLTMHKLKGRKTFNKQNLQDNDTTTTASSRP